jgi:hypothetical protein
MIEKYKLSIYDCHENGAEKIKTKFESFLEQTCGLELHVNSIITIHLSNKWFHSSKTKRQKALEIKRSFYTSLTYKTKAHNKQKENLGVCVCVYIYIYIYMNEEMQKLKIYYYYYYYYYL